MFVRLDGCDVITGGLRTVSVAGDALVTLPATFVTTTA
jgi:hypothetical protein